MKKRQPKKQFKLIDGHRTRICDYMNCRQNALHTIKIKKGVKIFRCNKHNMIMESVARESIINLVTPKYGTIISPDKKTFWEKVKGFVMVKK